MQANGTIRAMIAGHGQFTLRATDLDALLESNWDFSTDHLRREVKEMIGDPGYETHGLTRIELIMIIAELSGFGL